MRSQTAAGTARDGLGHGEEAVCRGEFGQQVTNSELSRARGWTLSLRLGKTHRAEKWLGCDEARPESLVTRVE